MKLPSRTQTVAAFLQHVHNFLLHAQNPTQVVSFSLFLLPTTKTGNPGIFWPQDE